MGSVTVQPSPCRDRKEQGGNQEERGDQPLDSAAARIGVDAEQDLDPILPQRGHDEEDRRDPGTSELDRWEAAWKGSAHGQQLLWRPMAREASREALSGRMWGLLGASTYSVRTRGGAGRALVSWACLIRSLAFQTTKRLRDERSEIVERS
jgi:hypothetical protein